MHFTQRLFQICIASMFLMATGCNFNDTIDSPATDPSSTGSEECIPLEDSLLCTRFSAQCGELKLLDNCEQPRQIDCGQCAEHNTCNTETALCECTPQSDEELCSALGLQCDTATTTDRCGKIREIDCGQCMDAHVQCEQNMCSGCLPETDAELCLRANATCGTIDLEDNCGNLRESVACGVCEGTSECNDENTCVCPDESDAELCARQGKECGMFVGMDLCGEERTADCGACPQGECQDDNTCSVCSPESDTNFCLRGGIECGDLTAEDNCGELRTVACGSCEPSMLCNPTTHQCDCPAPACVSGSSCGTVSNACGASVDCGSCTGVDEVCLDNACVCQPQSCGDRNAECGTFSSCGQTIDCGSCNSPDTCTNNTCVCKGETDAVLCLNQAAMCGNIAVVDQCGVTRNINCGRCRASEDCINNFCCENGQLCPVIK